MLFSASFKTIAVCANKCCMNFVKYMYMYVHYTSVLTKTPGKKPPLVKDTNFKWY